MHFCRQYVRIFSASIAQRAQVSGFPKTGGPELVQEGAALLGSGNSGKPVVFAGLFFRRERLTQN